MPAKPSKFGPRQKDIAMALNLSQSCVAIALSPQSRHRLPEQTVALIEAKARELKYRPQAQARILRSGRSHTVGVVFPSSRYHAPQEQIRKLALATLQRGYQLISIDLRWYEGNEDKAQDTLLRVAAEGIVFCNVGADALVGWREFLHDRDLPCVAMSSDLGEGVDEIWSDMRGAFREITLHHIDQGSKNLHLQMPWRNADSTDLQCGRSAIERIRGFTEAIRERGGEVMADPECKGVFDLPVKFSSRRPKIRGVVRYPLYREVFSDVYDVGYHETLRVMQAEKDRPDSIVCSNDQIAMGAMAACERLKLNVPADVRLSGADNVPFSRYCTVPLTTIEQTPDRLAEWSVERIVELIENPEQRQKPRRETVPCRLVLRESTKGVALSV